MHKKSMEAAAHLDSVDNDFDGDDGDSNEVSTKMQRSASKSSARKPIDLTKNNQEWRSNTGFHFTDNLHTAKPLSPSKRSQFAVKNNQAAFAQLIAVPQTDQLLSSYQFQYANN